MKRWLLTILTVLLLVSTAYAAEGDGVRVAIIDTGISTAAIDPTRIDGGANYICPQDDLEDKLGHGTAVSAIIVGSDPARIEGICPTATLVPLVYATRGEDSKQVKGNTAMVAQAVYDAIDVYHCDIINISSGSASGSERLKEAVEYAGKKGVLVISCAGNGQETNPGAVYYPGGYESVLCVGAANSDGSIAAFSQQNDTVDLLALGTDLRLASVKGTRIRGEGTSFATAIVTGAAAQIRTEHPDLTADEMRSILQKASRTVDGWQVFDLESALAYGTSPFSDVAEDAYYHDAVLWAVENGITGGTGGDRFGPDNECSRAQMLTFLWRAVGSPEPSAAGSRFTDVAKGSYYEKAVLWAVENGITGGTGGSAFSPDTVCTRAQMAVFLHRVAGEPTGVGTAPFADVAASAYYAPAVAWAYERGITSGTGDGVFSPDASCTRAQIVVFLQRWNDTK